MSYIDTKALDIGISASHLPLINKISLCESEASTTAVHYNNNKTLDKGPLQINTVHIPEMEDMGLNYNNWKDTVKFGLLLYKKEGTAAWYSSEKCWNN